MVKVKYKNDDPTAPKITNAYGKTFENDGKAVEIEDERLIAKAKGNPFFEVEGEKKKETEDGPDVGKLEKTAEKEREEAEKARRAAEAKAREAQRQKDAADRAQRDVTNARRA